MKIRIKNRENKQIECRENQTILEALQEAGIYIPALCAGRGTCGKCKVKILKGEIGSSKTDLQKEAGEKQTTGKVVLENGEYLACRTYAESDLLLELPEGDEQEILVEGVKPAASKDMDREAEWEGELFKESEETEEKLFIAVDIGTTTIAMALVEEGTGEVKDTFAALNRQRMHGADVISRIAAANNGQLEELHKLIVEDLQQGIVKLTQNGGLEVTKVIIAANTTMVHLLMGYSCESLGCHPFSSEHLGRIETTLKEMTAGDKFLVKQADEDDKPDLPVIVLPGISAFVGSDITADILICPGFFEEGISLLLDMGTNGEMVIGNKNRLIASSTAAGPAFEGGNITCGTGSIPGAISQIKIMNRRAVIGTIGGKQPPVGICGTGIIEAIAELKKNRLMETDGALKPPYDRSGFPLWAAATGEKVAIYQQDIRQLQLAKGAIRAGMEQLMEAFGCKPEEVDKVYLAGGFGTKLPIEAAIEIGLFPAEFRGKIESIGNGALLGTIAYGKQKGEEATDSLKELKMEIQLDEIVSRAENLNLALAEGFEELYLKYLEIGE